MNKFLIRSTALLSLASASVAQQCGVWTNEFAVGGFDASPTDFVVFDDGSGSKLYAGGDFTVAGLVGAKRVARWDGTAWSAMGEGFNLDVRDLAIVDLGSGDELYAAGRFQSSGAASTRRIAKWNGSTWIPLGNGLDDVALAMVGFDDGSGPALIVGGRFNLAGNGPAHSVARWDGANWSALGAGFGGLFTADEVTALEVHDDGTGAALYAAGNFAGSIAKWDGATWNVVGAGITGTILSLASYDDGLGSRYLLAGGNYLSTSNQALAGWNGSAWLDLGIGPVTGGIDKILVRQEGSELVAHLAGSFKLSAPPHEPRLLARWTPTGLTYDSSLAERVRAIAFFDDGSGAGEELYAGGPFTQLSSTTPEYVQRVVRRSASGWRRVMDGAHGLHRNWLATSFGLAVTSWTSPLTQRRELYFGGTFDGSEVDDALVAVGVWDGQAVRSIDAGLFGGVTAFGEWLVPNSGVELLTAGTNSGVFGYDGATWSPLGTNSPAGVNALASFTPPAANNEHVYAGGAFVLAGVPAGSYIAQFDGTSWTALGSGLNGLCYALAVWDPPGATPESLFAGGIFNAAGGAQALGIARWDGSAWHSFGLPGFQNVQDLRVWDDGTGERLYANTNQGLYRFDGTQWDFLATSGAVLEAFDDGSGPALYLSARTRLRNGAVETYSTATPLTAVHPVSAHHWIDENGVSRGLYFAGFFEAFGGLPNSGLARYSNPCSMLTSYCTAKVNSLGCSPQIGWTGSPSVTETQTTPFVITASDVLNNKAGLFFYGINGRKAQAYQGGTLCLNGPYIRTNVQNSFGNIAPPDCSGSFALDFSARLQGLIDVNLTVGTIVNGQWWYRDPAASFTVGFSNAIELQIRP